MNPNMKTINRFISDCRKRLNQQIILEVLAEVCLVITLISCLISLVYIFRGYAVERLSILALLAPMLLATLVYYIRRKKCDAKASLFADDFFSLNNALSSARSFARLTDKGAFHEVHFQRTSQQCSELKSSAIPIQKPWQKIIAASLYLCLCLVLLTYEDSPEIAAQKAEQEKLLAITKEINNSLKKKVEELEKTLTKEEKDELNKSTLKEKITKLKSESDKLNHLKKLAAIEQDLKKLKDSLSTQDDRRLLEKLSDKLANSLKNKKLAEEFQKGQYGQAAKELGKLKMNDSDKLKSLAQKNKNLQELSKAMQKALKDLKLNKSELAKAMKKFNGQISKSAQISKDMKFQKGDSQDSKNQMMSLSNKALSELKNTLMRMQMKTQLNNKMNSLNQSLMQMQTSLAKSEMPPSSNKGAGSESPELKLENNGTLKGLDFQSLQAKAHIGQEGNSQFSKEQARSGSAQKSVNQRTVNQENLKRQVESYIKRADIPPDVHNIVKDYFNSLHNLEKQND